MYSILLSLSLVVHAAPKIEKTVWNADEMRLLRSLSLSKLRTLVASDFPTNPIALLPKAREFGKSLFFDTRLSRDQRTSCATCHVPEKAFASDKVVLMKGDIGKRNVPSLWGAAWNDFFYWDGRKDSLWTQSVGILLDENGHGLPEKLVATRVLTHYRQEYEALFGKTTFSSIEKAKPKDISTVIANTARAIAAFETTLVPPRSVVDDYIDNVTSAKALDCVGAGLKLFIGKARCVQCHNGPLLSNGHFHNIGIPKNGRDDLRHGRFAAFVVDIPNDKYRCQGSYSGAGKDDCRHIEFAGVTNVYAAAYKTPSLRGVSKTAPYMHNGVYTSLSEVINHYDTAPYATVGESDLLPIGLNVQEKQDLECLLKQL